jgi:hypothetical protein
VATDQPTGVHLDPKDPVDAPIIARQVAAARQSGREGRDRARTTRGRADLEAAYDEGASEPEQDAKPAPAKRSGSRPAARGGGRRPGARGSGGRGAKWASGSWRPTLTPPRRVHDAGGLLVGMALYTVTITYLRYGPAGWKGWLAAKFLNRPMQGLPPSSLGAGTARPPRTAAQEAV